jgi:hypothetical protein
MQAPFNPFCTQYIAFFFKDQELETTTGTEAMMAPHTLRNLHKDKKLLKEVSSHPLSHSHPTLLHSADRQHNYSRSG